MYLFQVKCSIRARTENNDTSNYLNSKEFFAGIKVSTCPPVIYIGLGLWCLTPLLTIVQLYHGFMAVISFVEETRLPEKNHLLPQVTDEFYYTMLYRVHTAMCEDTDFTGCCKSQPCI